MSKQEEALHPGDVSLQEHSQPWSSMFPFLRHLLFCGGGGSQWRGWPPASFSLNPLDSHRLRPVGTFEILSEEKRFTLGHCVQSLSHDFGQLIMSEAVVGSLLLHG